MRIVFVTCPPKKGYEFLKILLEERLVAGGNIISGVRSLYHWKSEIRDEQEEILLMETSEAKVEAMINRLKTLHPYEIPKILTFEPNEGLAEYLNWVVLETNG